MTINKITGETFKTRKEAKEYYGSAYYNKLVKDKIIYFTNYIANNELPKNYQQDSKSKS